MEQSSLLDLPGHSLKLRRGIGGTEEKEIWEKKLVLDPKSFRFLSVPLWVQKLDYIIKSRHSETMSV